VAALGRTAWLRLIKSAHTAIWVFFASCVFGIPLGAILGRFDIVLVLVVLVLAEVACLK
jgi:hypothetical protein